MEAQIDRRGGTRPVSRPENELSAAQRFLYSTGLGQLILKGILIRPWVSRFAGWYMDSRLSTVHIKSFIRSSGIDMSPYPHRRYISFNDFFTRQICPEQRPVDSDPDALVAPCDGRLSAYRILPDSSFLIKETRYTLPGLLRSEELAAEFAGGLCLIFRLAVDNYHRYCYMDGGTEGESEFLPGCLHTVHPIALGVCDIYKENAREYTVLHTDSFGDVVQMEVGALMVGRICNHHRQGRFARGEEKGMFQFGGSTIVLLLKKDIAEVDEEFFLNTAEGLETAVRMGERIGRSAAKS